MMPTVVIYHKADFDGIFCREIARKFLPDAKLIGWDYGDPLPVSKNSSVVLFMLDISVDGLMDHQHLIWIDHHKSAIEKYSPQIKGYRIDGVAACRLAWHWFTNPEGQVNHSLLAIKQHFIDRAVEEPLAVRLAGEYDIWDKRDPDADLFQHGLRSRDLANDWSMLLTPDRHPTIAEIEALMDVGHDKNLLRPDGTMPNPTVVGLLESGKVVQYNKEQENVGIITSYGFTVEFEGLKFLACNHARFNSHLFTDGIRPEHQGLLGFNYDGKGKWRVSLYGVLGSDVDLSKIAVKYGGGGHKNACGFQVEKLPFL